MTSNGYWVRIAGQTYGPKTLEAMQAAIRTGEVGRKHEVSTDGELWQAAEAYPELFDIAEPSGDEDEFDRGGERSGGEPEGVARTPPVSHASSSANAGAKTSFNALGLAGFICAVTGLTLMFGPLIIFLLGAESVYFLVPLAIPLLMVAVTGLILSVVGMMRQGRIFATTGMIVGIVATFMGLVTGIGWLVVDPPGDRWINEVIRAAQTDIQRAESDFELELDAYRNPENEIEGPIDERRNALTRTFMRLVRAYDEYVTATAIRMGKFRTAFRQLSELRVAYDQFAEAIKLREGLQPVEALDRIGERPDAVKFLLDMLVLYQNKQINIEQAQSKFRAVRVVR